MIRVIPDNQAELSRRVDRRMAAAREWLELIEQARALPGFEDFLRPPRLEDLLPATVNGPVVVVNVSRWRCDALIVTAKGVRAVELTQLSGEAVVEQANRYLEAVQVNENAVQEVDLIWQQIDHGDRSPTAYQQYHSAKANFQAAHHTMEQTLNDVMEWLWDVIAEPILTVLGFTDAPGPGQPWPRLWWCPTGVLTLLPLHAAGYHASNSEVRPRTVIDRVVSSYTPTLRALLESTKRNTPVGRPGSDHARMLIIALPETFGQPRLPNVVRERDLLVGVFPDDRHTLLEEGAASRDMVRDALMRHWWVHFSCHGGQNLTEPSRGGLLLHDGMLSIADISASHHHGEFAFLSACKTATGGVTLLDEAITLAAALHYTGYRHVIGTLWSVYDTAAADLAEAVYTDLTVTGEFVPERAAHALHRATRRLRNKHRGSPSTWIPFTHTGP